MASLRFAVFGDSYVKRQGDFCSRLPFQLKFFGDEDLNLLEVPGSYLWDELTEYRPDVVLLHLGGNDIIEMPGTDQVNPLFKQMMALVKELRGMGAHVLVGEILPRAEFGLRAVSLKTFDKIRNGLNRKLRLALKHRFIFFRVHLRARDGSLHYHYDASDGVHLSPSGMRNYDKILRRQFGLRA